MTEFELAQLEYMAYAREQGLIGLMQAQADLINNDLMMLTSAVFGYLVVAYFVGAQLTKVQAGILNSLYVAVTSAASFSVLVGGFTVVAFSNHYSTITGNTQTATASNEFVLMGVTFNACIVLASLYFMWTVRHPKSE